MTEDEKLDLKLEYEMDAQDDRRYASRSAEEILEGIVDDFDAEPLQIVYAKLVAELGDYGMECEADSIFTDLLDSWTSYKSPYIETNKMLRAKNSELIKELQEYKHSQFTGGA